MNVIVPEKPSRNRLPGSFTRKGFFRATLIIAVFLVGWRAGFASGTIVTTTTELNIGNIFQNNGSDVNGPNADASQVCHYKGNTYVVWVDGNCRPWMTEVNDSTSATTTAPIDPGTDFTVTPDGHSRFSIGIDNNGYIHVTGGMHDYDTSSTGDDLVPYPARYVGQQILYWKSNLSQSVSGGFTFVGGLNASTSIPGQTWVTGRFINDINGELYYYSQVRAYHRGPNDYGAIPQGYFGIGLYHYNLSNGTWTALGGQPDHILPAGATYQTVLYWENSGYIAPYNWFDNYECTFQFDKNNRLHFAASVNTNTNIQGNNRIVYAYSDDGGNTWHKASGVAIPGLPLRGANGTANLADVVADNEIANGAFAGWTTVTADSQENPAVFNTGNYAPAGWYTWNGSSWNNTGNALNLAVGPANLGSLGLDNNLYMTNVGAAKMLKTAGVNSPSIGYDFYGFNTYQCLNEVGLRQTGVLYGIGIQNINSTDINETVLKTTITPAPLPYGWNDADIGSPQFPGNGGNAGYSNGTYVLTDYGDSIDNSADAIHYAYTTLTGDGVIIARVASQAGVAGSTLARAGVMMRNTLDAGSANVLMGITPSGGAVFSYRSTLNGGTNHPFYSGVTDPCWVKIVRAGNSFTGYYSVDAVNWIQAGALTITMNSTIHVGLAGASYQHGFNMQTSSFDNVSAYVAGLTMPNGIYRLVNANTAQVIAAYGQGTTNGTPLVQWPYDGDKGQLWNVTSMGNGQYEITGVQSGLSMDVEGISTAPGVALQLWAYWAGPNQTWTITEENPGWYEIVSVNSGLSLTVNGGSTNSGATIVQEPWARGADQFWSFEAP